MEPVMHKWVFAFQLFCWVLLPTAFSVEGIRGDGKVRAVNLGGWLVIEGWIKPSLFDGIPNGDMLDGTKIQLKSVSSQKYVCAENGGGLAVTVSRDTASAWETFTLWRVSMSEFQLRSNLGQFWTCNGEGCSVAATAGSPSTNEIFYFERNNNRVHIKLSNGIYLQASEGNELTADFPGTPGWDDNSATFIMTIAANDLHGDYQLANGYGLKEATEVFQNHRNSFVTIEDFAFLYRHGINAVRIPVGWWIAFDPDPPAPFVGGSLGALDNAFSWALDCNIKCIIDLHAAPGSQNGMEHSASRDGWTNWPTSPDYISKSLNVIDFLAKRYGKHPALLGIELLNEPSASAVTLDTLVIYYKQGYEIVRKYSSSAYVIFCQRIGNADPTELYAANIGSHNVVVDLHYYNLFDTYFSNMSPADNIDFIYKNRQTQLQTLNAANGPLLFIGEWTNEWDAGNASSEAEYIEFGKAQLEVYGKASFGWAYWTIKNEQNHWDFEWNIKNDYLPFGNVSNQQLPFGNQTNQMYPMVVLGNSPDDRKGSRRLIIILLVVSLLFFHLL